MTEHSRVDASQGGRARSSAERRQSRLDRARGAGAALGLAACVLALPGCCLTRPPDAKTIFEAGIKGWRTPEAAFETFRVAFGAELLELEYRSLSARFKREQQISLATYMVARRKLIESKPYLALLSRAEVVGGSAVGDGRHVLEVEAAGKRFQVELVREGWFQIYSGTDFLADGPVDFDSAVSVRGDAEQQTLTATVSVPREDLAGSDLSKRTSFQVEQQWKIDRLGDLAAP